MREIDLNLETLDLNKFDFIITSLENLYSNSELTKCLCDTNNESKIEYQYSNCGYEILEDIVYSKSKQDDGFIRFFMNSVNTFHMNHKCSTKTLTCFTLFLWKQIKYNFMRDEQSNTTNLDSLCKKSFSKYLSLMLEQIIANLILNNNKIVKRFNFYDGAKNDFKKNPEYYRNIVNGLCRNRELYSNLVFKAFYKYEKYNLEKENFDSNKFYISVTTFTSNTKYNFDLTSGSSSNTEFEFKVKKGLHILLDDSRFQLIKKLYAENK
jgi:hypothetical protein